MEQGRDEWPQEPERRTRKFHRKSRRGCQACKRRHVRCDLRDPICTNCAARGDQCIYPEPAQAGPSSRQSEINDAAAARPSVPEVRQRRISGPWSLLGGQPTDPFDSLAIDMPWRSQELLYHSATYRNELWKLVFGPFYDIHLAPASRCTDDPAMERCTILMAAKHQYGLTGDCDWITEPTYLHHKSQVMRLLVEQMHRHPASPSNWSFAVILFLTSMESLAGDIHAAETHINGLMMLLETARHQSRELYNAGRILLRISLIFLCLLEASKQDEATKFNPPRWHNSGSPFAPTRGWDWANVVYLLSHIVAEFMVRKGRLVTAIPTDTSDTAFIGWLLGTIQRFPLTPGGQTQQLYRDPQLKMWVLAAASYVLLLVSLDIPIANSARPRTEPGTWELQRLREWWDAKTSAWLEAKTLPGEEMAMDMLDEVARLTSVEGEGVIVQLLEEMEALARQRAEH